LTPVSAAIDEPLAEGPSRFSARRRALAIAVVVALGVGALFGLRQAGERWWESATELPGPTAFELAPAQFDALFTYQDLARAVPALAQLNGPVRLRAQDEFGGTWYVSYEGGDLAGTDVAVDCSFDVARDAQAAHEQFMTWFELGGFGQQRRAPIAVDVEPLALEWGDECAAGILLEHGARIGNTLLVRRAERVIWIEWRGPVFEQAGELLPVVEPSLAAMVALER